MTVASIPCNDYLDKVIKLNPFKKQPKNWQRADIAAVLAIERGLKAGLARFLGITRAAIYNWLAGRIRSEPIYLAARECAELCMERNRGKVTWDKKLQRFRPKSGSSGA